MPDPTTRGHGTMWKTPEARALLVGCAYNLAVTDMTGPTTVNARTPGQR
jgi:hypothetical protein